MANSFNRQASSGNVEGDYETPGSGGNFGSNQEFNQQMMQYDMGASGPDNRVECPRCHRKFDPSRIDQHERICQKVKFHVTEKGEKDTRDEIQKLKDRNQKGFDPSRYLPEGAEYVPKKDYPAKPTGKSGVAGRTGVSGGVAKRA